ncbi:MAG: class I SAM-dependent methyltransferase [Burkholderiaceae bacterium]
MLLYPEEPPSEWIRRFAPLVSAGARVMDLACGAGRHTRFFADRGCRVVAIDREPRIDNGLASRPDVDVRRADLEQGAWPLGGEVFDAFVVTNYLHRPLFPHILAALAPGGVLLYETFALGNAAFGKPGNPAFLLAPRELLDAFGTDLRVIAFEDGYVETPRPAMVQRIAAVKPAAGGTLAAKQVALHPF